MDLTHESWASGTPTQEKTAAEFDVDATNVQCDVPEIELVEAAVSAADGFYGIDIT